MSNWSNLFKVKYDKVWLVHSSKAQKGQQKSSAAFIHHTQKKKLCRVWGTRVRPIFGPSVRTDTSVSLGRPFLVSRKYRQIPSSVLAHLPHLPLSHQYHTRTSSLIAKATESISFRYSFFTFQHNRHGSSKIFYKIDTVALLFVFDKYCPIMD